ncbi:MAG: hypothetical protein ACRCW0_04120 [Clostridium sp.]
MVWDKDIFYVILVLNSPIILMFVILFAIKVNKKKKQVEVNEESESSIENNVEENFSIKKFVILEVLKLVSIPSIIIFYNYFICIKLIEILQ